MNKKLLFGFGAAIAAILTGNAATVSYTLHDTAGNQALDWNITGINIPQFNPSLGTLTAITYRAEGTVAGNAKGENTGGSAATITLNLQATISTAGPLFSTFSTIPLATQSFLATAWDGLTDFGGDSGKTYTGLTGSDNDSSTVNSSNSLWAVFLGFYVGTGNVPLTASFSAIGSSQATGSANVATEFNATAGGKLFIDYTYNETQVPEASTYAAVGFLGLAVFGAYRRARK